MRDEHAIDLLDLFPPAATVSSTPVALTASSLALIGPVPEASVIHFALNHLRAEADQAASSSLSDKARGKRRAQEEYADEAEEPLVPATPARPRRVLIASPDEASLRDELANECDVSLLGQRVDNETARLLNRIDFRYLPTSAHLTYFLATVYTSSSGAAQDAQLAFTATGASAQVDPSCLPHEPTMVILHGATSYLNEPDQARSGIEAYGSMLAHFVSTFEHIAPSRPFLVLFDPLAIDLALPVLPLHLAESGNGRKRGVEGVGSTGERDQMSLSRIIERFFDWIGEAEEINSGDSPRQQSQFRRFLLSCRASPRMRTRMPSQQQRVGLEYVMHRVGDKDPEGEDEDGVRIEVPA
ncbi:uncharacterized protein JCM10292_001542 [Rhodotorula paludigena]|uniref:uncharacterized protein n=1 Tax=Rhodotorula paludigena TaxID=86838 RepID=UPI00316FCB38